MYNIGYYIYRESFIHELDPRTKIIAVIALSILIMETNYIGLLAIASILLISTHMARIPVISWLKTIKPALPFFFFLFLIYIISSPGEPLVAIGPIQISCQGIYTGFTQVARFILLILTASLLTISTRATEITMGLEYLIRPVNIIGWSSHDIAMMVSLALRFVPTLIAELNSIKDAQLSRNFNFSSRGIKKKIRAVTYLALPLTINLFHRCDELVNAMEARGYHKGPRTHFNELTLNRIDFCVITIFTVATGLCLFL